MLKPYDTLTFSMQKKTHRIIELKKVLARESLRERWGYIAFFLFVALVFFRLDSYSEYVTNVINNTFTFTTNPTTPTLGIINATLLVLVTLSIIYLLYQVKKTKKIKRDYTTLRLDIIACIDSDFCNHNMTCDCRDTYIKSMHKEHGIDLIFK